MNQGSLQTTGKNTDLAISGEGFFTIKQEEGLSSPGTVIL